MAYISNLGLAFRDIVARYSDHIALFYPESNKRVTYGELNSASERLALILWSKGLRQGQVAAFFHNKSSDAFAAMLACLRLGVIYTNIDPESPWERVRKIFKSCAPDLIINSFERLPFEGEFAQSATPPVLNLMSLPDTHGEVAVPALELVQGGAPAYIMFTSGSTGMPKGAVMSHANLLGFTQWSIQRFDITPHDVLTNLNPIYFDNSVFDFYTALFSGACMVPLTPPQVKDVRLLVRLVEAAKCTIWFSVPSLLVYLLTTRALGSENLPFVRKFIFGGEGFPKPKLKKLFELYGARAELENVYGPTECTCICSARTIESSDFDDMLNLAALGPVAQNFDFEIIPLDEGNPDFGELFLRGPQVGLGYYRDPERTAKAFVQNPSHQKYADVGYCTGDLVQKDVNGCLHFKGRADFQIKHMGYRIELEEIEAAFNIISEVHECTVVYQRLPNGLGQIVAFVSTTGLISTEELQDMVATRVPPYMVPRRINIVANLPKNANGKTDRNALLEQLSINMP